MNVMCDKNQFQYHMCQLSSLFHSVIAICEVQAETTVAIDDDNNNDNEKKSSASRRLHWFDDCCFLIRQLSANVVHKSSPIDATDSDEDALQCRQLK